MEEFSEAAPILINNWINSGDHEIMTTSPYKKLKKPLLSLKNRDFEGEHSRRLYSYTEESVERLNIYVEDFFQTRTILLEEAEVAKARGNDARVAEIEESLWQITLRVEEMYRSMEIIAEDMGSLVSLTFSDEGDSASPGKKVKQKNL